MDTATMAEVPGIVVWSNGEGTSYVSIYWRATEPLVAGRTYRVLDVSSSAAGKKEFTVLPAATWVTTEELELRTGLDVTEGRSAGEVSCLTRYKPMPCSSDQEPSPDHVTLSTLWQTSLWITAYAFHPVGPVPPMKERAVFWRDGETPADLGSKPWLVGTGSLPITEGAARYCYRIAVQNLLDGSERAWEGCLEHGDLPELKAIEASPEVIKAEIERCLEPPAGLEKEWCEQSMLACQREYGKPTESDCENVANRCAALAESEESADDDDAGADSPDAGEPRKARKRSAGDSGCSVPGGSSGGSSPLLLLAATFAAAALRRRTRASGPPDSNC